MTAGWPTLASQLLWSSMKSHRLLNIIPMTYGSYIHGPRMNPIYFVFPISFQHQIVLKHKIIPLAAYVLYLSANKQNVLFNTQN